MLFRYKQMVLLLSLLFVVQAYADSDESDLSVFVTVDSASNGLNQYLKDKTSIYVVMPDLEASLLYSKLIRQCSKGIAEKWKRVTSDAKCEDCVFLVATPSDQGAQTITWTESSGFVYKGLGGFDTKLKTITENDRRVEMKIYPDRKLAKPIYEAKGSSKGEKSLSRVIRTICAAMMHDFPKELSGKVVEASLRED